MPGRRPQQIGIGRLADTFSYRAPPLRTVTDERRRRKYADPDCGIRFRHRRLESNRHTVSPRIGTAAEQRGWMGNDLLNALNTAIGALLVVALLRASRFLGAA